MKVHLDGDVFLLVESFTKDIEVRVNDSKRRKLKVGDKLIFINRDNDCRICREVKELVYFNNFLEVVENYPISRIYKEGVSSSDYLKLMERFYSEEEVLENGVIAIILK